jgi:hypothetical protein
VGVRPIEESVSLTVAGIYQRIKNYELTVALKPDPRLFLQGLSEDERAALETQRFAPTALGQVEALMQGLPVMVPKWYVGGRSYPEVRGWHPYSHGRVKWFIVTADDKITPGGNDGSGFPSERSLKHAARRAGYR